MPTDFEGKKVLVMGLGLLGGGAATAKWFVRHGARVTVTDLKTKKELRESIKKLGRAARKIKFVLGKHREGDFKKNEIIIVNPGVPRGSKFLKIAKKAGKAITNDARIFFDLVPNPIIAVTGTRGKTTTVNWIANFLKAKYPKVKIGGNTPEAPLFSLLESLPPKNTPVVLELSSWQLELLPRARRAPDIAVITNLYPDHLNRYSQMRAYALAKANIFRHQAKSGILILNKSNKWTDFFITQKPKSRIVYFPFKPGINSKDFIEKYGRHNWENLMAAALAAVKFGVSRKTIKKSLHSLPFLEFREELIYQRKNLKVINDSAATSPEAAIAALKRFSHKEELVLIAGGTDKNLSYKEWASVVKRYVRPENLFLLQGSATKKMIRELNRIGYFSENKPQLFESLPPILRSIRNSQKTSARGGSAIGGKNYKLTTIILFSPSAASFGKFKNEFDRGREFNNHTKRIFANRS